QTLMIRLLGPRGASAVMGLLMLAIGSSAAAAATIATPTTALQTATAVQAGRVDSAQQALGRAAQAVAAPVATAVETISGSIIQARPAAAVTVSLAPDYAKEASWLYKSGWPLYALVDRYRAGAPLDEESSCIA